MTMINLECCTGMKHAVEHGYIERPVTYEKDRTRIDLNYLVMFHPTGQRPFVIHYCPFCGVLQEEKIIKTM
jgi:hypothetical protein